MLAVELVHRALHRERRGGCALGVIGLIQRRAEHREDRVADELVDRSPVGDHEISHPRQVAVQHLHDARRVALLGEPGVAAQVGHEHGDLALVSAEPQPFRRLEQGLRDFRRDVPAERVPDEIALAQSADHLVERARQLADLVA